MNIKKEYTKKKVFLVLYITFVILTFVGAGYIFYNKGAVNAGYSVVPMLFGVNFGNLYRNSKKAIEENEEK